MVRTAPRDMTLLCINTARHYAARHLPNDMILPYIAGKKNYVISVPAEFSSIGGNSLRDKFHVGLWAT